MYLGTYLTYQPRVGERWIAGARGGGKGKYRTFGVFAAPGGGGGGKGGGVGGERGGGGGGWGGGGRGVV